MKLPKYFYFRVKAKNHGTVIEVEDASDTDVVEVVRCKDCVYGEQDDIGRWFCSDLGCQIGNEDGSGYCADGERRETNETD